MAQVLIHLLRGHALLQPLVAILERQIGDHHCQWTQNFAQSAGCVGLALADLVRLDTGEPRFEQVVIQHQINGTALLDAFDFVLWHIAYTAQRQRGPADLSQAFGIRLPLYDHQIGITRHERPVHLAFSRQVAGFVIRIDRIQGTGREIHTAPVPGMRKNDIAIRGSVLPVGIGGEVQPICPDQSGFPGQGQVHPGLLQMLEKPHIRLARSPAGFPQCLFGKAALAQIGLCRFASLVPQPGREIAGSLIEQVGQLAAFCFNLDGLRGEAQFVQGQVCKFGQVSHGGDEIQSAPALDEVDRIPTGIAPGVTAPAFMTILTSVDAEGSRVISFV